YSRWVVPSIGGFISGRREAYEYLPHTVSEFPDGEDMLQILRTAGFTSTQQHRLTFGIATIYIATK
ncbi:MAG: class I SAM-dependent methyltransferase, partial [Bacteroidota bacterium]